MNRELGSRRGAAVNSVAALLVGCVAALAAPVSAQTVTADDAEAALAKAHSALAEAQSAIAKAEAAVAPASSFAHLPPDAVALEHYRGTPQVSIEAGYAMNVSTHNSGTFMVTLHHLDGSLVGRFLLGAPQDTATADMTSHELLETGFANCPPNGRSRGAGLDRDGRRVTFGWSCGGDRNGKGAVTHIYMLEADGPDLRASYHGLGPEASQSIHAEHRYQPMTEEVLAAAARRTLERYEEEQRRQEAARIARAEAAAARRAEEAERRKMWSAAVTGFMDGLQEVGQQYEQQQAQTRAFNAELANMTRLAQERQRLEHEARRRAQETARRQAEVARVAATTPRPVGTHPAPALDTQSPGATTPAVPASLPADPPSSPVAGASCKMLPGKTYTNRSLPRASREAAEREALDGYCPAAGHPSLGPVTCTSESEPLVTVDGNGRVRKTGERTLYTCSAQVTCPPVEHCESRPASGSRQ